MAWKQKVPAPSSHSQPKQSSVAVGTMIMNMWQEVQAKLGSASGKVTASSKICSVGYFEEAMTRPALPSPAIDCYHIHKAHTRSLLLLHSSLCLTLAEVRSSLEQRMDRSISGPLAPRLPRMEEPVVEQSMQQTSGPDALSSDLWLAVFKSLDPTSLAMAGAVCRRWAGLVREDSLWQRHWMERYGGEQISVLSSNAVGGCALRVSRNAQREEARAIQLLSGQPDLGTTGHLQPALAHAASDQGQATCQPHAGSSSHTEQHDTGPPSRWKDLFHFSHEVESNWQHGKSTSLTMEGQAVRCLQLADNTLVSCSGSISHQDCSIRVWDVAQGSCKRVLRGHMGPIWCMQYEPNLGRIATGSEDYTVRYWDAHTGNSVVMQDPDSAVRCIHMDPAGRQLVAGTEFGRLLLWDMDQLEDTLSTAVQHVVAEFERLAQAQGLGRSAHRGPGGQVPSTGLSAEQLLDGRHVEADGSNHVRVVDAADEGKAISAIQVEGGLCASTSIEPLSGIQLWDVSRNSWQLAATLGEPDMMFANSLSFDKGIGVLVAGCGDRNVRVWDLATGMRRHLLTGHIGEIQSHQFDATTLASADLEGQICIWDMRSGAMRHVLRHNEKLHTFQFDGNQLVSGTHDGRVCLWDLRKGALVTEWYSHSDKVWAVAIDQYNIASASLDCTVGLRSFLPRPDEVRSSTPMHTLRGVGRFTSALTGLSSTPANMSRSTNSSTQTLSEIDGSMSSRVASVSGLSRLAHSQASRTPPPGATGLTSDEGSGSEDTNAMSIR